MTGAAVHRRRGSHADDDEHQQRRHHRLEHERSTEVHTRAVGAPVAIAIGATVGLDALFGGPLTGALMNPARSIGPALAAGRLRDLWIYLVAPVVGALIGASTHLALRGPVPVPAGRVG